jgi:hypothetical protein
MPVVVEETEVSQQSMLDGHGLSIKVHLRVHHGKKDGLHAQYFDFFQMLSGAYDTPSGVYGGCLTSDRLLALSQKMFEIEQAEKGPEKPFIIKWGYEHNG